MAPWAYVASVAYHDMFWYPRYAEKRMQPILEGEWGRLFASWGTVQADERGYPDVGRVDGRITRMTIKQLLEGLRLLGMAVAESPEWKPKKKAAAGS